MSSSRFPTKSNDKTPPAKNGCSLDCPRRRKETDEIPPNQKGPCKVRIYPPPCVPTSRPCTPPPCQPSESIDKPLIRYAPFCFPRISPCVPPPRPNIYREKQSSLLKLNSEVFKAFPPCPDPSRCKIIPTTTDSNSNLICRNSPPCSFCRKFSSWPPVSQPTCKIGSKYIQTGEKNICLQSQPRVITITSFMPPKGCSTPIDICVPNEKFDRNRDLKIELYIHQIPEEETDDTAQNSEEASTKKKEQIAGPEYKDKASVNTTRGGAIPESMDKAEVNINIRNVSQNEEREQVYENVEKLNEGVSSADNVASESGVSRMNDPIEDQIEIESTVTVSALKSKVQDKKGSIDATTSTEVNVEQYIARERTSMSRGTQP